MDKLKELYKDILKEEINPKEIETIFNERQKEVIDNLKENILLIASAGTGKTNTLAYRVSEIINREEAKGDEILCITFTNKACNEMKDRIKKIVGREGNKVVIKTFHSFCFDIIKKEAKKRTDIFSDFIIYDEDDCEELIKTVNYFNHPVANLKKFIDLVKEYKIRYNLHSENSLEDYKKIIQVLKVREKEIFENVFYIKTADPNFIKEMKKVLFEKGNSIVDAYDKALRNNRALDFWDLIIETKNLFEDEKVYLPLRKKFRFINIDEMQDTSVLEYDIIEKLFCGNNILFCGDRFQTIYEWRGSEPKKIVEKFKEKHNPKEIVFNKNYRSTKILTNASFEYLKNSFEEEVLNTYKEDIKSVAINEGEKISVNSFNNINEEVEFIYNEIKRLNLPKEDLSKVCILTRNNNYNVKLSEKLSSLIKSEDNLEFILIDQFRLFRRAEVKDVLAFLRLIINKQDSNSLMRIIKRFPFGVGEETINVITSKEYKEVGIKFSDFINPNIYKYFDVFLPLVNEFKNDNIIVFDVESTGVNTTEDEIIQIAAIRLNSKGEVTERFEKFLKNIKSVGESENVHGFSDKFLKENGEDRKKVLNDFLEFSKGSIIVGHNVQFDINIFKSELKRNGLSEPKFLGFFDTLDIYRRFYPNLINHKLESLSRFFNTNHKPSHDAMDDILATSELLVYTIKNNIIPTSLFRQEYVLNHLNKFKNLSENLSEFIGESEELKPKDILTLVIEKFDIKKLYKEETQKRIGHLRELYRIFEENEEKLKNNRDMLINILKMTSLSNGDIERMFSKRKRIPIITVHQAKGLEFDYVFLAGLQEGIFPSYMAIKNDKLDEEERVFYVAITRAKKKLYLTYPIVDFNNYEKTPCKFLDLIPNNFVVKDNK